MVAVLGSIRNKRISLFSAEEARRRDGSVVAMLVSIRNERVLKGIHGDCLGFDP